jgi:hypothetical protein
MPQSDHVLRDTALWAGGMSGTVRGIATPHKLQAEARARKRADRRLVVGPLENRWPRRVSFMR